MDLEMLAQRIDGLHTDTIQADGLLEGLGVVLTTGIEHTDGLNHLTLRNATTIVSYADTEMILHRNLDAVAGIHLKFIDGVVDDLLQQHVDAVLGKRTVTQSSNIHART